MKTPLCRGRLSPKAPRAHREDEDEQAAVFGIAAPAFVLASALFAVEGPSSRFGLPHLRSDIGDKLANQLCIGQKGLSIHDLWGRGIYDAQLEGHFMTIKKGMVAPPELLAKAAEILAGRTDHNGVHYGTCTANSTGWVITSPAPGNHVKIGDNESINFNWSQIRPYCNEAHIDYAAASGGRARNLMVLKHSNGTEVTVNTAFLVPGTVSLTCYPKYGKNLGPELWFLVPVKGGPPAQAPTLEVLVKKPDKPEAAFMRWINELRGSAHLPALARLPSGLGNPGQKLLAQNDTIHHQIAHLEQVQSMLRGSGGLFIGEDRVKGGNWGDMAWLLWNSPRHRDLLLTNKANRLAVTMISAKGEKLVVLTFAKYEAGSGPTLPTAIPAAPPDHIRPVLSGP